MTELSVDQPLPVAPPGPRTAGWWGMVMVIATEAALFVYLLFSYYYLASQHVGPWPPSGAPALRLALPNTVVLLLSSGAAWWGQSGVERGRQGRLRLGLLVALMLGGVFFAVQILEWSHKTFTPATDSYGSLYFTVTGVHMAHVLIGLVMLGFVLAWSFTHRFTAERHLHVTVAVLYWHFVDVVWLLVFTTFYLTPRIGLF